MIYSQDLANRHSIIHSPSFTFLVGPKHTKLTIQSGLAQHVSKPLHNLMNGHTRESKHRIAVLEEEDVETFVAFCEYAYTGDYSVPQPEPEPEEDPRAGVVESAPSTATWRETYRSASVSSSTVPPPAPSPPPEHRHGGYGSVSGSAYQESQPDTLVPGSETPVPEPVAESAPAEVNTEEVSAPAPVAEPEPATEPVPEDDITAYEETGAATEEPPEDVPVEEFPEVTDEPVAVPVEAPGPWELDQPGSKRSKKDKKKKKAKKASKGAYLESEPPMEEDIPPCEPTSLTPPSTPPTYAEPEAEPEEYSAEPEWPTEAEAEPQAEDWPEPEEPVSEAPMEDSWTQNQSNSQTRQRPMLDMSFAQQQAVSPCEPGLSLWDEFTSLQYTDESNPNPKPTSQPLPYLTFHAKVYVFATRYLIPALAQLCLRKLHADLLTLPLETDPSLAAPKAQMVLDLVQYAYTKTARLEPISPTSATQLRENELRKLVVHYAACKIKELARYHVDESAGVTPSLGTVDKVERIDATRSLRSLLDMTTELASDLVYRMM